ncbi:MAG: hypothetical protein Kow0080_01500 [Candidatus Promineifilaceae bacterium]
MYGVLNTVRCTLITENKEDYEQFCINDGWIEANGACGVAEGHGAGGGSGDLLFVDAANGRDFD